MATIDIDTAVRNNRAAVDAFIVASLAVPMDRWGKPRAPGKWSPAQVVEHVVLVYEVGARALSGASGLPSPPRFVRPLIRFMMRRTVLRSGRFPRSRTVAAFDPSASAVPAGSAEALCARLRTASEAFDRRATEMVASGAPAFEHPVFGTFGVSEYVQFQAYHTKHHQSQLGVS
jgi:DinB superfamily